MHELAPIAAAFDYIDVEGGPLVAAEAELGLGNGQNMTIRAGGGATQASPPLAPFTHYEVILDHDPPRFWHQFAGDKDRLVYALVPRLLIAHHTVRHGGVKTMTTSRQLLPPKVQRTLIRLPITTMEELAVVLSDIAGRTVTPDALRPK